tara:strand:+ start:665 stop:1201 length:537 start_codon:yes stop_codon:yes gene_type:complete
MGGQMSEETQVSKEAVAENDTKSTESNDNSELIAESKKYRHRSQAAESKVAELEAKINSFTDEKLKEKEEFKTLYEKVSVENEENKVGADKWKNYEATKRETLLSKLSEDEKPEWENAPLNLLNNYVAKTDIASNPNHIVNKSRKVSDTPKDWTKLSKSELKDNWDAIYNNALSNQKN